jgi:hypothetical protein
MKTALALPLVVAGVSIDNETINNRVRRQDDERDGSRRYAQLTDMMKHYNNDFDERKYWTYGCNCLVLGDRPMSDPGAGPPVDALDTVCKHYKDCNQCAKAEFGDMCIGEFVEYSYSKKKGEITCDDSNTACQRTLCECDLGFAKAHVAKKDVFNADYHIFWSTLANGWEPKDNCPRGGGGPYDPQCCGGYDKPFLLYNAETKDCCDDGSIAKKDQC